MPTQPLRGRTQTCRWEEELWPRPEPQQRGYSGGTGRRDKEDVYTTQLTHFVHTVQSLPPCSNVRTQIAVTFNHLPLLTRRMASPAGQRKVADLPPRM